jgi:hypothetical protein
MEYEIDFAIIYSNSFNTRELMKKVTRIANIKTPGFSSMSARYGIKTPNAFEGGFSTKYKKSIDQLYKIIEQYVKKGLIKEFIIDIWDEKGQSIIHNSEMKFRGPNVTKVKIKQCKQFDEDITT